MGEGQGSSPALFPWKGTVGHADVAEDGADDPKTPVRLSDEAVVTKLHETFV